MRRRPIWIAGCWMLGLATCWSAQLPLPGSVTADPENTLEKKESLYHATAPTTVKIPAKNGNMNFLVRIGSEKNATPLTIFWKDGTRTDYPMRIQGGAHGSKDASILLAANKNYYIRPNLGYYANAQRRSTMLRGWDKFESASHHVTRFQIRKSGADTQVWIDGRLYQNESGKTADRVELKLVKDSAFGWEPVEKEDKRRIGDCLVLDLAPFARPASWAEVMGPMGWKNAFEKAILPWKPGIQMLGKERVPIHVVPPARNIDTLGMGFLWCPSDDGIGFYWRRGTLDALPEACILTVPKDTYSEAYVLCAADPDAAKFEPRDPDRVPEFTLRMTRHSSGRGDAFADSTVRVPMEKSASEKNAEQVGMTRLPNGKEVPLWLVRVPLKPGLISDILNEDESKYGFGNHVHTSSYLDIELTDRIPGVEEADAFPLSLDAVQKRNYAPPYRRSSVHVFGLTLRRSPVSLTVRPKNEAALNVFYTENMAPMEFALKANQDGDYRLKREIADVDGTVVHHSESVEPLKREQGKKVLFDGHKSLPPGWYSMRVCVAAQQADRAAVEHRSTFVILPPDTRKQDFDSPFGTWWFSWAHGGTSDVKRVGAAMNALGLRHTMNAPKEMEKDQVYTWCIPWKQPGAASVESWVDGLDQHIAETLKKYPYVNTVMLYHESDCYGGRFPTELWGVEPPKLSETSEKNWQFRMKHVLPGLKMIRTKYPQLKIQIGNTGDSCVMVYEMFKHGLPTEYVDYLGSEVLGQTMPPERPHLYGLHAAWFLRETARLFGSKAQITATYEWINRMHTKLGFRRQAEWYVRDALLARAYGFHTISMAAIHDAGQGYFHSIWGNGAYCFRYPYMEPKPAFMAMAHHTRVLDSSSFVRMIPVGSKLSLYVMEFKRADGKYVYPIWVLRGTMDVKTQFPAGASLEQCDLYGREKTFTGDLTASPSVQYLISDKPIASVIPGKTAFPSETPPEKHLAVEPMKSLQGITLDPWAGYKRLHGEFPYYMPAQGKYQFTEINDPERGACIQIELKPEGKDPFPFIYEHVFLKFDKPVPAKGPFQYVGMWVRGNASWAEIMPSVIASDGKTSRLIKPEWPGNENVNFNGWTYMKFPLPNDPKWRDGAVSLGSILITMPRQVLHGTEFVRNPDLSIAIGEISFF